jgi:molybdopterin converting factor small subunit
MQMHTEQSQKILDDCHEHRDIVSIKVRLFGTARSAAGLTELVIDTPSSSSDRKLARLIQRSIPKLVGPVIDLESGELKTSHTFNLNGLNFIDGDVTLRDGDEILLFSSQAGG